MKVEFSWRYGVVGIYKDRDTPAVRIYPLPFVRITVKNPESTEKRN
jgi:hypothetical protein